MSVAYVCYQDRDRTMNLCYGEMWTRWKEADLFLITTNAVVKNERLIMGAGSAGQAKGQFAGIAKSLGTAVMAGGVRKEKGNGEVVCNPYYLIVSPRWPEAKLGLFQTKDHYKDDSDMFLISTGIQHLLEWLPRGRDKLGREPLVVMPMPGTGHGGLHPDQVMSYVEKLPDNIEIWQRAHERPVQLPSDHPLNAILKSTFYEETVCDLLGIERKELARLVKEINVRMNVSDDIGRLQRYFLIKAYREGGDSGGAWHMSRNELKRLLEEVKGE